MKKVAALLALALAAFALVACGDDDDNGGTTANENGAATTEAGGEEEAAGGGQAGGPTLSIEADPDGALAYTTTEASTEAGKTTLEIENQSATPHDVAIEDASGKTIAQTEVVTEGSDSTAADLKPGKYTFYCSVPGHREAGMEGTLTVE